MNKNRRIGVTGIVQITLIILKLFKLINISWFWVFSPTIFVFGFIICIVLISIFIAFIKAIWKSLDK